MDRGEGLRKATLLGPLSLCGEELFGREERDARLPGYFGLRESEEMHYADTPRQGLACVPHEMEHLRAREPVGALCPIAIYPHLDVRQEARRVLDLVDDDRSLEALEEELGLLYRKPPLQRIIEGDVVTAAFRNVLEERRLPYLPRPRDEEDREGLCNCENGCFDGSRDIHGGSLHVDQTNIEVYYSRAPSGYTALLPAVMALHFVNAIANL